MDMDNLKAKKQFSTLPNTYVIFITENDFFGKGKAIYPIERINLATKELFNDGEHILYVNGAYSNAEDDSDLAKLIHDFRCSSAEDMLLKPLEDRTRYFKETPEGVEHMCKAMEERLNENSTMKAIQIAIRMLKKGVLSFEDISEYSELPIEKIKELAAQINPATV